MALTKDLAERRLTPTQWITEGKVKGKRRTPKPKTQELRKRFLKIFAQANGRATAQEVIDSIQTDSQLIESAKKLVAFCQKTMKVGSVAEYRSMLPGFFGDVFGTEFERKTFEDHVPSIKSTVTTTKASFDRDTLVRLLKMASPRDKALLYIASYGFRLGEVVSRHMDDIEDRGEYAVVKLWADETKTSESRRQFISKECLGIIRDYRKLLPPRVQNSTWLFPGEKTHYLEPPAGRALKRLFKAAGLKDTEREIFSSHGLRAFAEDIMRECGLSDTYTKQIVGHDTGTEENYKRWPAIEKEWVAKCLEKMTWLSEKSELVTKQSKEISELRSELDQLKTPEGLIEILAKSMSKMDKKAFAEALKARLELPEKSDDKGVQSGN